ncbi:PREDICTED: uncharacterized protein LOC104722859 isoform X2 [Camelina sativa]|uniref:Uncharacterized protein LOC104722859 isoform X2 n=1 Tax=Camelina sativa TaxID=90675 RepID=A0ABM1QM10_CAMSA|nr:PREDICTED: uncharacterized protein LOC104722859 isoform X2 [Camelina sativa]XP_019087797.1 PREDICTED: uncharacterized protein LOC104722859 isoform X2 [Camelina sativa]XP_019087798.1 PREDICTED: uncharacterized protein LOC104722859 isoform X2 [Camelina sativa]
MYPKVKANNEAVNYKQRGSCLNSNYLQSRVSEKDQEDDLQIYVAKIPKIYIPSVLISVSESTELNNKPIRGADIEVKHKPKASPILRPRAVVSSPDNDAMIGNINKIEERKAKKVLKSDDHIKSRASQRKNVSTTTNVKISHRIVAKQSGVSSKGSQMI